jgi:hypothetical protein
MVTTCTACRNTNKPRDLPQSVFIYFLGYFTFIVIALISTVDCTFYKLFGHI